MSDAIFNDVDSLTRRMNEGVPNGVIEDVIEEVKLVLWKHIVGDIYGGFVPLYYERRYGLSDPENLVTEVESDGTIVVTSKETANQSLVKGYEFSNRQTGAFLQLLESGHMGIWKHGFPRPAVSNAQKEIDHSSRIRQIIKRAIQREM